MWAPGGFGGGIRYRGLAMCNGRGYSLWACCILRYLELHGACISMIYLI